MGRNSGHVDVEQNSAVGSDVDVSPQPHVVELPLGHAESARAEFSQVFGSVRGNLGAVSLVGAVRAVQSAVAALFDAETAAGSAALTREAREEAQGGVAR